MTERPVFLSARAIPLAVFLLLASALGFFNLTGDLMNDDEGTYLYSAWRVGAGDTPYSGFTLVQAPLSFWLMGGIFKICGPSVGAARAVSYLFILGAALLIYSAARRALGLTPVIAAASAAMFLFTKHIFFLGRSFMPDDFMLFWGAAALVAFLRVEEKGPTPGFVLAGAFSGLAALSKLNGVLIFAAFFLYFIWIGLAEKETLRSLVRKSLFLWAGFLLTFGLPFLALVLFVPGAGYQMAGFHAGKTALAEGTFWTRPFVRIAQFVGNHDYGLVSAAAVGMGFAPGLGYKKRMALLLSAAMPFVFVILPGRFFVRYILFALIPLALFFGIGLDALLGRRKTRAFILPLVLVLAVISLGPTFEPRKLGGFDRETRALSAFVRDHTRPGEFVFGDDPFINFLARRPCPPGLVDVSEAWTRSGRIASADIRRQCEATRTALIFVEKGHSAHHLVSLTDFPKFQAYLDEKFNRAAVVKREFLDVEVYLRKSP